MSIQPSSTPGARSTGRSASAPKVRRRHLILLLALAVGTLLACAIIAQGTRWLLLKHPENLKDDQDGKLNRLLEVNKNLFKAYILRDDFRQVFAGHSSHSRLIRLTHWIEKARSARIPQISGFVKLIEKWEPYIRNSLREGCSNSFAEGINTKIRVIQRMAYGYKDFRYLRLKIIQQFNFREISSVFDGL